MGEPKLLKKVEVAQKVMERHHHQKMTQQHRLEMILQLLKVQIHQMKTVNQRLPRDLMIPHQIQIKMITMVVTAQKLLRRLLIMTEIRIMAEALERIQMLMMTLQVSSLLLLLLSYFYLSEQELDTGLSKASKVVQESPVVVLSQFKIKNMIKFRPKILKQTNFYQFSIFDF